MDVMEGETGRPDYLKYDDVELLNRMDAEYLVQHLTLFPIEQIGSRKWLTQHANLEKLNLQKTGNSSTEGKAFTARGKLNLTKRRMVCQAHYNTMVHNDEFVMVALTSHDKLGLLIHELLVIEIWKEKVLPHILKALAEQPSNINIHLVLYQETTIVNLLEVSVNFG